ncbi:MAG: glycosyltransferase family 87 protein [Phycisphaerales bacterium]
MGQQGGYALLAILLIATMFQFQRGTIKHLNLAREHAKQQEAAEASGATIEPLEKDHKGAIGRWRSEIHDFWEGENIYRGLHPNMPFVVVLLSPFTYVSVPMMALLFNLCKLAAVLATFWMAVRIANHRDDRMPEWVALLGVLAVIDFYVGDIQHGNTNVFVAASVVAHLYCYRRGRDSLAGVFLALGICLKLTPALFLLYWLWQREWKVLGATATALPAMVLSPALLTGWEFYAVCMATWWTELIGPSLGGAWYPIHINQSLPAMIGRFFSGGDAGNYLWNPEEHAVPIEFGWVTLLDLGPQGARMLLRALQVAMLAWTLWAIGWSRLDRDDGRRALHYGLLVALMLLLNQRSWDHHATYLVVAHVALAYAAARSALPLRTRRWIGWSQFATVVWMLLVSGDLIEEIYGDDGAHRVLAYGTAFWHFLAVWALCLILTTKLRRAKNPYLCEDAGEN